MRYARSTFIRNPDKSSTSCRKEEGPDECDCPVWFLAHEAQASSTVPFCGHSPALRPAFAPGPPRVCEQLHRLVGAQHARAAGPPRQCRTRRAPRLRAASPRARGRGRAVDPSRGRRQRKHARRQTEISSPPTMGRARASECQLARWSGDPGGAGRGREKTLGCRRCCQPCRRRRVTSWRRHRHLRADAPRADFAAWMPLADPPRRRVEQPPPQRLCGRVCDALTAPLPEAGGLVAGVDGDCGGPVAVFAGSLAHRKVDAPGRYPWR